MDFCEMIVLNLRVFYSYFIFCWYEICDFIQPIYDMC